ncbi:MAG: ATP-binding cassette domain-containing protein [Pseudomonadota bacterium]
MTLALALSNLTVTSPSGRELLSVPSLEVPAGGALGIRGPSGAGKSTLFAALMGLAPSMSGQVHWGETELSALPSPEAAAFRRAQMGVIFQDYPLFDELSAAGNAGVQALFAPRNERQHILSEAAEQLERVQIPTQTRPVASLSGGERQRVAVARALSHRPAIVLADEPTASLDQETGEAITSLLLDYCQTAGATLIVVSHDETLLRRIPNILELEHGRPKAP